MPYVAAYDMFAVITELNVVSFITVLTYCLENGKGIKSILLATTAIAVFQAAVSVLSNGSMMKIQEKYAKTSREFDLLLGEKFMNMDFDILEGPTGREKIKKQKTRFQKLPRRTINKFTPFKHTKNTNANENQLKE